MAAFALASAPEACAQAPAPATPNILFLLSDDHSYPGLSCYGDGNVRTPNIDRLAAEGMKFHRFFCVSPQCVPSRAGFMTGRSAVAARMTRFSSPLPRDEIIFPELLRSDAGYFTGVCGRTYHLDGPGAAARYIPIDKMLETLGLKTFKERLDFVEVNQPPDYTARVNEFFDRKPAEKPFFLWMNFSNPHYPWTTKAGEPDPASLKLPGYLPDMPSMRRSLATYYGEVNRLDGQVQEILDILAKRGFAENTLVVFAGDNGWDVPHGKGSLHDPGLNVPFIVRWPGVVRPGTESHALISGEDFAPTLLAAVGLAAPARMTGVSFLPLLRGEAFTPRRHIFAARGQHGGWAPMSADTTSSTFDLSRCARNDRYKFVYNGTPWMPYSPMDFAREASWRDMVTANTQGTLAPEFRRAYFAHPRPIYELYDLERDPWEITNLVGNPRVAAIERELRAALAEKMSRDFDYLPLPALEPTDDRGAHVATAVPSKTTGKKQK